MRTTLKTGGVLLALVVSLAANAEGGFQDSSGYYVGADFAWPQTRIDYREPDLPGYEISPDINGFQGGLIAGYDVQGDRYVIGFAVDAGLDTTSLGSADPNGNGYSAIDFDWHAHLRARVGYALPRDSLVFVTFGLSFAEITIDDVDPGFGEDRAFLKGWTVGAGLERRIGDHLLLQLEYVYDDYGKGSYTLSAPSGSPFFPYYQADIDVTVRALRTTIAWHF